MMQFSSSHRLSCIQELLHVSIFSTHDRGVNVVKFVSTSSPLTTVARIFSSQQSTMAASTRAIDKHRVAASLKCMLVGDALAAPVHWFYSPDKLRKEYGQLDGMVAPKPTHAESMIQGMSYSGSIDILHDKAIYYEGSSLKQSLTEEQIAARRDDHGNFVGATADERVHYHQSLVAGQNTANACIARLLIRYLGEKNANQQDYYDPDEFLERFKEYMTTPPNKDDKSQIAFHNDTYLDVYLRGFFTSASDPNKRLRDCALSQRDTWSIGSLDGVLMAIPMIAAYADEPESMVIGRVIEHAMLTHKSVTVYMVLSILTPLLLELFRGADLKESLERAMSKMRPPACTGREMRDSYVDHYGPGNIPKHEKWLQHMKTTDEEFFPDFIEEMIALENDEDVGGWDDRPNSRLATACYCEQAFSIVLYLSYKYRDDPQKALLQNAMMGGHSTARGSVLGAILGAAHPAAVPFVDDLCAKDEIEKEVSALVDTIG